MFEHVQTDGNYYIIRKFPRRNFGQLLKRHYGTTKLEHLYEYMGLNFTKKGTIRIHKFFIPELVYLLRKFGYPRSTIKPIVQNTWLVNTTREVEPRVDRHAVSQKMNVELTDFQDQFLEKYDIHKQQYQLNGYILAFDQGLGKTVTSLALMTSLHKRQVIILAPKNTLDSVWRAHINRMFEQNMNVSLSTEGEIDPRADFIIGTYKSISKIAAKADQLMDSDEIGLIVDESHNFLRMNSKRTQELIAFREQIQSQDTLLMSGTPIKALGVELMPLLMILDKYFDEDALQIFKKALGVNTTLASDILKTRLKVMSHRKTKEEALNLPPKSEKIKKISIPNGDKYTVDSVKSQALDFIAERREYHENRMDEYVRVFYNVLDAIEPQVDDKAGFERYNELIDRFRQKPPKAMNKQDRDDIQWTNQFEREQLIPVMTMEQKKEFRRVKSAVKYLPLKLQGEVLGRLLTNLRMEMTSALVRHSGLRDIINNATKKTVIFTSFKDSVKTAEEWALEQGFRPLLIHGDNSDEAKATVSKFMKEPDTNPLIATTQTMSTGVTLTSANTMVFLNKPWRHSDLEQASDRVHRLTQDTPVFIYTLLLDTGDDPNLSTRMEDIMEWSKDQFESIVENE